MNTFLITFEVLIPSLPVQQTVISDQIKKFEEWARPTSNVWLIKTYYNRDYVMGSLRPLIGPRDRLLIMRVSNDWIALHLPNDVVNWMKTGL